MITLNHLFEVIFFTSHFGSPAFFSSGLELEYWGRVWAFLHSSPAGIPERLGVGTGRGGSIYFIVLLCAYALHFHAHLYVKNFPTCRLSLWRLYHLASKYPWILLGTRNAIIICKISSMEIM